MHIINVASVGQESIDFGNVMLDDGYDFLTAYRQTKLALVRLTFDPAEDLRESGIAVNYLHPAALMSTRMVLETDYFVGAMSTVEEGARAVESLATSPELDGVTGEYCDGEQRERANPQASTKEARRRLRMFSE